MKKESVLGKKKERLDVNYSIKTLGQNTITRAYIIF